MDINKRTVEKLRRVARREHLALSRLLADIKKLDKPINQKYKFVKDMY